MITSPTPGAVSGGGAPYQNTPAPPWLGEGADAALIPALDLTGIASGKVTPGGGDDIGGLGMYNVPAPEWLGSEEWSGYGTTAAPTGKGKKPPKNVKELGAGFALGSLSGPGRKEIEAATARKTKANQKASDAQQAYYRSQFMNDDELDRAKLAATMRLMTHQGRSPMQDQLAARSQTLRNLIGY
jgi:hypothetical protein